MQIIIQKEKVNVYDIFSTTVKMQGSSLSNSDVNKESLEQCTFCRLTHRCEDINNERDLIVVF